MSMWKPNDPKDEGCACVQGPCPVHDRPAPATSPESWRWTDLQKITRENEAKSANDDSLECQRATTEPEPSPKFYDMIDKLPDEPGVLACGQPEPAKE